MFCMKCGASLPDSAQFCYHCGASVGPAATPGQAPAAMGAPPYAQPAPARRRVSGLELAGDLIALLGMVILIVDYWADWWVLLVIGLFFLVVGLVLYLFAWLHKQRAQPAGPYPTPYQPPPQA